LAAWSSLVTESSHWSRIRSWAFRDIEG